MLKVSEGTDGTRRRASSPSLPPPPPADELTYPMHVILRYRLEARLLRKELAVAELPTAWREGMSELLGVDGDSYGDDKGCLQDVHWASLAVGYAGGFDCPLPTPKLGLLNPL